MFLWISAACSWKSSPPCSRRSVQHVSVGPRSVFWDHPQQSSGAVLRERHIRFPSSVVANGFRGCMQQFFQSSASQVELRTRRRHQDFGEGFRSGS